jgi:hypothetical protein
MSARITDTDRGFRAVLSRMAEKRRVKVGILSDEPKEISEDASYRDEPASLLEIAGYHEFGAPDAGIPMRSFIRATVDEKGDEITAAINSQARLVVLGKATAIVAMERLGAFVKGLIQARIAAGIEPANAESTVLRKGSSKPLVDTGQLRSSIAYVVEGGR